MKFEKVLCVCGSGLGSSFLVQMNVEKILKKIGVEDVEVAHSAATDVYKGVADLFVIGKDMYDICSPYGDCIVLESIISLPELEKKLSAYLSEKGVI